MLINCVRPGVLLTRARLVRLAKALINDDLPTLDLPTTATSRSESGRSATRCAGWRNCSGTGGTGGTYLAGDYLATSEPSAHTAARKPTSAINKLRPRGALASSP